MGRSCGFRLETGGLWVAACGRNDREDAGGRAGDSATEGQCQTRIRRLVQPQRVGKARENSRVRAAPARVRTGQPRQPGVGLHSLGCRHALVVLAADVPVCVRDAGDGQYHAVFGCVSVARVLQGTGVGGAEGLPGFKKEYLWEWSASGAVADRRGNTKLRN
ncbi:hypothetical protein D3C76_1341510 [compost metagenome]